MKNVAYVARIVIFFYLKLGAMIVSTRVKSIERRTGYITLVSKSLEEEPLRRSRKRSKAILKYESRNADLNTWAALTSFVAPF
jgi:hypothetical protein